MVDYCHLPTLYVTMPSKAVMSSFGKLNFSSFVAQDFISLIYSLLLSFILLLQDDHENMQEMDILDMNVLDETENDNEIPAEHNADDADNFFQDEDAILSEEHDYRTFESECDGGEPEVTNLTWKVSNKVSYHMFFFLNVILFLCIQMDEFEILDKGEDMEGEDIEAPTRNVVCARKCLFLD